MKSAIVYISRSGQTKKVAEAIREVLPGDVVITPAAECPPSLSEYDVVFFGMPLHDFGPVKGAKEFLDAQSAGLSVAMFVTHAAPEGVPHIEPWLARCRDSASAARLVGFFDCQGALAQPVIDAMLRSDSPDAQRWARNDNSQGQPDETRLRKAREFALDVVAKMERALGEGEMAESNASARAAD